MARAVVGAARDRPGGQLFAAGAGPAVRAKAPPLDASAVPGAFVGARSPAARGATEALVALALAVDALAIDARAAISLIAGLPEPPRKA